MIYNINDPDAIALNGPILLDDMGLPRFWFTAWAALKPTGGAPSTWRSRVRGIESFYLYSDMVAGNGVLDDALADCDLSKLSSLLQGYFVSLRNRTRITQSTESQWQAALKFVQGTLGTLISSPGYSNRLIRLEDLLKEMKLLDAHLFVGVNHQPEKTRSLPSQVVEGLYEMLDPTSATNPFRGNSSKWRVYTVFMLLLHQGLRRAEALCMPEDAIKSAFDSNRQNTRYWVNVKYNEYELDRRYTTPGIKTKDSFRLLPVSKTMARVVREYAENYRGKIDHSFLLNSQKNNPLSAEAVTKMFHKISNSLPPSLQKLMTDIAGDNSISAHDLRHTCAVFRLNQLLARGIPKDVAMQQMRSFFGWSRTSVMPLKYARAVFDERLASVWNNSFDERIDILRNLPGGKNANGIEYSKPE